MSSDYLEKASQWFSLRGLAMDLPSFCLWWGGSLWVSSSSAASSCLGIDTPWLNEWCHHFASIRIADISNTLGMEAVNIGSLPSTACGWVAASIPKMVASGTLPVRGCKGYISVPPVLGTQAHKATVEASYEGPVIPPFFCYHHTL